MANFMSSARIKFKGSDTLEELNQCFTVGKEYHADVSSAGNFFVYDDKGETWAIDPDDDDFAIVE
jgi:hypothetical protein